MSFWNKNKLPAEYKDLTEDQITELLAKGKTAEADAATQKAAAEAAVAAKTKADTDLATERARAKKLEEDLAAASGNRDNNNNNNNDNNRNQGPPADAEWITDPNGSFNKAVAPTAAVALHGAIMAARILADQFIRQQGPIDARLWAKYGKDVEAAVNALPPDQRIMPQTWVNQFTFIKGIHLNEIAKEAQGAGDAFFAETSTSTGAGLNNGQNGGNADADKLTPAEEAIAKKMGRTPEQYLASKKKMQFGPSA